MSTQEDLQRLLDADLPCGDLQEHLALFYSQCHRDHTSYVVQAEARLHAVRDAKFRQHLNVLCLEKRDVIAYFIAQFSKRMDLPVPAAVKDHA